MAIFANSDAAQNIAIALIEHAGRILIGPRSATTTLAGLWEFPGGKVEPGESVEEAAVRETREEAGLTVQPGEILLTTEFVYAHGVVRLHFIRCSLTQPLSESLPSPQTPFRWVSLAELNNYEFPAGNAEILAILAKHAASGPLGGISD